MERFALIGFFGALGAISRYALQNAATSAVGHPTVLGTFVVNVSGAFVLGLFVGLTEHRFPVSANVRAACAVGFLGAYTTFSTLMLESIDRVEGGDTPLALFYIAASVIAGLAAVYVGLALGRAAT